MCKEKELTEAAYRYYVDDACIEDIAKQLHRKVAQKQKPPFAEKPEFTPEELEMEKMFLFESEETENLLGIRKKKTRKPIYGIYNRTSGRWIQGCLQGQIQTILFTSIKACKQERTERNLNPEEFKAALYGWRME